MKNNRHTAAQTPKELLNDLRSLVTDTEAMVSDTVTEHTADAVSALRNRFEAAQERLNTLYAGAKKQAVAGAKYTDETIRENPYQSLAVAAGVGLVVGILLGRRSK